VIDDGFDLGGVKDAVLPALHQVEDGDGRRNLVAEHAVELEDLAVLEGLVHQVAVEDLLGDGLSHVLLPVTKADED